MLEVKTVSLVDLIIFIDISIFLFIKYRQIFIIRYLEMHQKLRETNPRTPILKHLRFMNW